MPVSSREYRSLQNALASSRIEGLQVTEQTERDCARLINGKTTADNIVAEILRRPAAKVH